MPVPILRVHKKLFGERCVLAREQEPSEKPPEGELQKMVAEADEKELGAIVARFTQSYNAEQWPPGNVIICALNERGEEALGDVHAAQMTAKSPIGNVSNEKEPRKKLEMTPDLYDAAITK